jgi:CBS domain containing-hemolysin-like protein
MTETNTEEGLWHCICRKFSKKETVRETLEDLIEEAGSDEAESNLSTQEQELLNNILYLKDKRCGQIMVPRADIVAFQKDGTAEELCQLMSDKGHSRIPIYGESLDDIVGMVHIIDVARALMKGNRRIKAGSLDMHLVKFVSPSMHVLDLLNDMQKNKMHIALVVDEYGGIDGLVTIEDLLEEIVGDIEDEYDVGDEPEILMQGQRVIIAAGHAELADIEEKTGLQLLQNLEDNENEIDTLGGLICAMVERVPQRGEVIAGKDGISFRILDVDSRRIKRVMIVLPQEVEIAENSAKNS